MPLTVEIAFRADVEPGLEALGRFERAATSAQGRLEESSVRLRRAAEQIQAAPPRAALAEREALREALRAQERLTRGRLELLRSEEAQAETLAREGVERRSRLEEAFQTRRLSLAASAARTLARQDAAVAANFAAGWEAALGRWQEKVLNATQQAQNLFHTFAQASSRAVSDILFKTLKGKTVEFREIWQRFTDTLLRAFVDMVARMVMAWAMSGLARIFGFGMPGIGPSLPALGSMASAFPFLGALGITGAGALAGSFVGGTSTRSTLASVGLGAATGAAIGTFLLPGLGTVAGGLLGGLGGALSKIFDEGGEIPEPIIGRGLRTGRSFGFRLDDQPERVVKGRGRVGMTIQFAPVINVRGTDVGTAEGRRRLARELVRELRWEIKRLDELALQRA